MRDPSVENSRQAGSDVHLLVANKGEFAGIVSRRIEFDGAVLGRAEWPFAIVLERERIRSCAESAVFAGLLRLLGQRMVARIRLMGAHWIKGVAENVGDLLRVRDIVRSEALFHGHPERSAGCFELPESRLRGERSSLRGWC